MRLAQMESCSTAAARNVSLALRTTFLPSWVFKSQASLAMLVVLPAPLMPATRITVGGVETSAHHSWNTVFSEEKPLVLRGTIAKVELVNPHAWIWIDVKGGDGTITKWGVEGGPPNGLIRNGITKDSLKIGEELIVHGYGARDETTYQVAGVKYEKADGQEFWLANEGAEATAKARGNLK